MQIKKHVPCKEELQQLFDDLSSHYQGIAHDFEKRIAHIEVQIEYLKRMVSNNLFVPEIKTEEFKERRKRKQ